jgi:hypothetical protein
MASSNTDKKHFFVLLFSELLTAEAIKSTITMAEFEFWLKFRIR